MTFNDISELFGLMPGAWWSSKCLVKEKGVASPKLLWSSKEDLTNEIQNDHPLSLSLSLSLLDVR